MVTPVEQDAAPAVDVGQLAEQRRRRGRAQEIGRDHPGQVLDVAEMDPDGRQGRRDDGLLQRAQEHGEHDAGDDLVDRGRRQRSVERRRAARRAAGGRRRSGAPGAVGTGSGRKGHCRLAFPEPPGGHTGMGMNEGRRHLCRAGAAISMPACRAGGMRNRAPARARPAPGAHPAALPVGRKLLRYCKASPCWVTSRPSTSACSPTRSGTKNAMPLSSRKVTTPDQASVAAIP